MSADFVLVAFFPELSFEPYSVSYKPYADILPLCSYQLPHKKRPLAVLCIGLEHSVIMSENPLTDDLKAFCRRLELTYNNASNDN